MSRNILIKKYKEELLKDKNKKAIIDKAKGSSQDQVDIRLGKRERTSKEWENVAKAEDMLREFAKEMWEKDSMAKKWFKNPDDLFHDLMDEFKLSYRKPKFPT